MAENIVIATFPVESEAYQALSELKRETSNANYTIYQAVVVKKENDRLNMRDGFDTGKETDDTWNGGLIGVLLGGSVGMLIGSAVDTGDVAANISLLEQAGDCMTEGETAMLLLAREDYETALTAKLNAFHANITRMDAAEVAAEVEHAQEVQKKLAKEARANLREERSNNFKATVAKKREEIKSWFDSLGKK